MRTALVVPTLAVTAILLSACDEAPEGARDAGSIVRVYTSVDETFARQILDEYSRRSGVVVETVFDSEAGKTTGLVQRIRVEKDRPAADVFWSGEVFNTLLLARDGLLAPHAGASDDVLPERFRGADGRWRAVGLRARVLAFDPKRTSEEELPTSMAELAKPEIASRLAIANPLFGTTHGQVAALVALWGEAKTREYLSTLRANGVRIVDGNSAAVREVISGAAKFGLTDTDDVWAAQKTGASLDLRYIDLGDGGTLLIPTSVGVVAGCPHPEVARKLADFLASADVERMLYESDSRNIPVREGLRRELGAELPPQTQVPYEHIAEHMGTAAQLVRETLLR